MTLNVHVVAHQDDWMLFRGDAAAEQLADPEHPVVFIHTTAGDAGDRQGWWEARELATVLAVRRQLGDLPITISRPRVKGHGLQRYACGHAVLYFLRCADGGKQGEGFRSQRRRSLSRLRDSGQPLPTVDGSGRYRSWEEFCTTLARIVVRERRAHRPRVQAADTWLHSGDFDPQRNPGDHADHRATAEAVRSFAAAAGYGRSWCLTYCSREQPANLTESTAAAKHQLFSAYGEELGRLLGAGAGINAEEWAWWGLKSYVRSLPPGQGCLKVGISSASGR
jgi:hypothetical protein